jgi:putative DeoR family transcriptional regulator (stage III sporulation protein D)
MKHNVEERAVRLGEYIIEKKTTVRESARAFGVSKSTVHKDLTCRLPRLNSGLYQEVRAVLDVNKEERHLRGGEATRQKYMRVKREA